MKLDWVKYNLLPAVFGVVFLAGLGYGAWSWWQTFRTNSGLTSALQLQEQRFQALTHVTRSSEPYPSPANLARLRQNRVELDEIYGGLKAVAARPVTVPPQSSVQFASRLAQTLKRLHSAARDKEVMLPDRFTFGFKDIGRLAPASEVPALTKQLIVTEALCVNLFGCGIQRLDTFGCESATPTTNSLYRRTPFTLQFTCQTPTLQKFLNNLQTMGWLFSVRSIKVTTTLKSPRADGLQPAGGGPGLPMMPGPGAFAPGMFPPGFLTPDAARRAGARTTPPAGVPDARTAATLPAPLIEELPQNILSVTMNLELIEFEAEPPPTRKST